MKKTIMIIINIFMILLIAYHSFLYQTTGYKMILKITCSAQSLLLGIINLIYLFNIKQSRKHNITISIGLFLSLLGDYFILYDFIKGAFFFALGHISFLIAHHTIKKTNPLDFIISIGAFIGCLIFLLNSPHETLDNLAFKIAAILYSFIISLMLGKATSNFIHLKSRKTFTIFIASILFFFSDIMLVTSFFYPNLKWADNTCLTTYFTSLSIFGLSNLLK